MEVIQPYVVTPWEDRVAVTIDQDTEKAIEAANSTQGILIATSSSERGGAVRIGEAIHDTLSSALNGELAIYSVTLGIRTEQNGFWFCGIPLVSAFLWCQHFSGTPNS
jgi:hypothetical protein